MQGDHQHSPHTSDPKDQDGAYLELVSISTEAKAVAAERQECADPQRRDELWARYLELMKDWDTVHERFAVHNRTCLTQASDVLKRYSP
jgi:hypothetical protein